jgi:Fe-S cluster assembly iron-binding protein IscA
MNYNLYTDKANKFNCNIEIEGTSLSKSKVRLVIESDDMSYMFNGSIENNGVCEVSIPKTKHFLPEGSRGLMRLEVIADDVYFEPWSSEFTVKTNKKVNVVVAEQVEEKPKLRVQVMEQPIEEVKPKITETRNPQPKTTKTVGFTKEELLKKLKR